jgi:hypothetical protein
MQGTENQRTMERNWQIENYNTEINNLNAAAKATDKARRIGNVFGVASVGLAVASGGTSLAASGLFK